MLLIRDDVTRLDAIHFVCSKVEVVKYFSQYLADYRFTGMPFSVGLYVLMMLKNSMLEYFSIFAGNGVSDKNSQLQTFRNLMA